MSKRAEDLAKQLYPDPKLENYDDILVYRADRDNAIMGRINVVRVYEQAEKDLALTVEDIKQIIRIHYNIVFQDSSGITCGDVAEEVLRRFNKYKEV